MDKALLLFCGLLIGFLPGCEKERSSAASAPPDITGEPMLWRVERDGKTSHLLGTIHLGIPAESLPAPVWDAFSAGTTFVSEADTRNLDPKLVMGMGALPPGRTLEQMLTPEQWKALNAQLPLVPRSQLTRFKPWLVTVLLTQQTIPTELQVQPMDQTLLERAASEAKKLVFLETPKEQLALFNDIPEDDMLASLIEFLDDPEEARRMMGQLFEGYQSGDESQVQEAVMFSMKDHPEQYARIIVQRNKNWMPTLVPLLEQGDTFIAVGLGHLLGDEGLLALLSARGFQITRVTK